MKPPAISIKQVRTADELRQAQRIRRIVLEAEQGFPHEVNVDGLDPSALHVLVLDRGEPVGTARVTKCSETEGMLARIALLPSHRGKALGKRMLRHLEALAKRAGLETIVVEPHAHLEPFFRSLGYETVPGRVELGGHQLIRLRKRVTASAVIERTPRSFPEPRAFRGSARPASTTPKTTAGGSEGRSQC